MKIVVAIDGGLLVSQNPERGIQGQKEAVVRLVNNLGEMVKVGHELVITHGNGPQVGNMLFRAEVASHAVYSLPLDICGADTQGATGYLFQQTWYNWLHEQGITKDVATLITQVIIDEEENPSLTTKNIGPFFDRDRAHAYEINRGWTFIMIPGHGYQRVVPAMLPRRIIEAGSIRYLLERGVIVICAGGGGIPVRADGAGGLVGVESVVDKAYTAALLAHEIGAPTLVFISSWETIEPVFQSSSDGLTCLPLSELQDLIKQRPDLGDSIRTKLIASCRFLQEGGQSVLLVSPEQLGARPELGWGVRLVADQIVSKAK